MKRLFAVVLAAACVAGSTSGFARGGMGHFAGGGRGGHGVNPAFLQNSAPQMPAFENRTPAPLASPSQARDQRGKLLQLCSSVRLLRFIVWSFLKARPVRPGSIQWGNVTGDRGHL